MTFLDTIAIPAMQDLGLVRPGGSLGNDDATLVLNVCNAMIDRWNAERWCHSGLDILTLSLTANKGSYTIGKKLLIGDPTPDFDQPRPVMIQNGVILLSGLEYPVKIAKPNEWQAINEKTNKALLPDTIYCDYNWPVATLYVHAVPLCSTATALKLMAWRPLAQFVTTGDAINLAPSYIEALQSNLAVRLGSKLGVAVPPAVLSTAVEAKNAIRMFNAEAVGIPVESGSPPPPQPQQ